MKNYVIIGGGIASLGCIDGIRSCDKDSSITLISAEPIAPYARPLISYYLENKTTAEKMQYRSIDFYKDSNVRILCNTRASEIIDATVTCDNGTKVSFDKLLVATGSTPFVPPISGIETVEKKFTFMTLEDAMNIEKNIDDNSRVLIVGAGLIGLKCAEGIKNKVKEITVCDLSDKVLSSILDKECADIVQKNIEKSGIKFMLSDSVESFEANKAVMKSGKKLDFDVLVMAVGVRPCLDLLRSVGAEIKRGVIVNERMETSVENIYAAGDIVQCRDISSDTEKIMAILPNAYMGGVCAGKNMAGGCDVFANQIPMNSIGFFGYHIMTAGSYDGELYEESDGENVKKLYVKDNRLIGFIILGNVQKTGIYTSLIRNKTPLDTIDFNAIKKDPSLLPFSRDYRDEKLGGLVK